MQKHELIIIGAGPAGLTAAIYAKRAGLDVMLMDKGMGGGQILNTSDIENWPGQKRIKGANLGAAFRDHAEHLGCAFTKTSVQKLVSGNDGHLIVTQGGEYAAAAVIVASGASHRRLGCAGEREFMGAGIGYCAVCDAPFYEGEEIAVVGGGNTAVEEAVYLARFASKVTLIHRRDRFRADKAAVDRAVDTPNITVVMDSVVESIDGGDMVESVTVKNVHTGATKAIAIAGVFLFVGVEPNTSFLDGGFEQAEGGWLKTDERMCSSVPGVFVAGDVRASPLRQIVTAAGDGAVAAMSAYHWVASLKERECV